MDVSTQIISEKGKQSYLYKMTKGNRRTRLLAKCRKFVVQSPLELNFYIIKPVFPFLFSWQQQEEKKD